MVAASLVLAWGLTVFGDVLCAGPAIFLTCAGILWHRRLWRLLALLLILSPASIAVGIGAVTYVCGTARLWTVGLPSVKLDNVDADTRLQSASTGCIVNGSEWIWQIPNNVTVTLLAFAFGPMRGTYAGPYPTEQNAREALTFASRLPWEDVENDVALVDGRRILFRTGLGSKLAASLDMIPQIGPRAAIWQDRVLIVQLSGHAPGQERHVSVIALVDTDSGKVIAYYGAFPLFLHSLPQQWT